MTLNILKPSQCAKWVQLWHLNSKLILFEFCKRNCISKRKRPGPISGQSYLCVMLCSFLLYQPSLVLHRLCGYVAFENWKNEPIIIRSLFDWQWNKVSHLKEPCYDIAYLQKVKRAVQAQVSPTKHMLFHILLTKAADRLEKIAQISKFYPFLKLWVKYFICSAWVQTQLLLPSIYCHITKLLWISTIK